MSQSSETRQIPAEGRRESYGSWLEREGVPVHTAPILFNLSLNTEFVYGERFAFTDRYVSDESYFGAEPKLAALPYGEIVYTNNFIPNFKHIKLDAPPEGASRGEGFARRYLRLGHNRMLTFAAEYPVGTYTTAHWHE